MKLTLGQIKKITVGTLRIRENADDVHFSKITQAQEDAFLVIGNKSALSTTGVRLDFWVDSPYVTYTVLEDERYEVKIDSVLTSHLRAASHTPITVTLPAGGHAHRVTICLPGHNISGVLCFAYLTSDHFNAESVIQALAARATTRPRSLRWNLPPT